MGIWARRFQLGLMFGLHPLTANTDGEMGDASIQKRSILYDGYHAPTAFQSRPTSLCDFMAVGRLMDGFTFGVASLAHLRD
jgi:hypothetical protein